MRILQRNLKRTYLIVGNMTTTNVLLFEFRCNIFIGVIIINEMPGLVASGTPCIIKQIKSKNLFCMVYCVQQSVLISSIKCTQQN
jgi:hypothetical protein